VIRTAASTASDVETARLLARLLVALLEKTMKPVVRSASPATTAAICERLEDTCSSSDALSGELIANVAAA
jgi:hypothetical protein